MLSGVTTFFRRLLHLLSGMTRWERIVLGVCSLFVVLSSVGLARQYYLEHTVLIPSAGGTYIEGSVGNLQPLLPWFVVQNDVNRDILSLVFSGLLRYDPQTKKIVEDLATMKVSPEGKIYKLTLKPNLFWHDSTKEQPHPVTVDDVLFTFQTIQQPGFPNLLLQQNFRGVSVSKLDDRTVEFDLDEPYSFFPSNLTLGLLPKKAFEGIPVSKLDQALDFGFKPIGAGPYRVKTIVQTELSSEVTLEKFPRELEPTYRLDRVVFRIFPDYSTLVADLHTLQGVRLVAKDKDGEPIIPKRFSHRDYTLPQYVALFFNLSKPALQDQKLRLGLQLGTNKQEIIDAIHEQSIVDTPLLEIDTSDWRYQYDSEAAQGALFASRWSLPEKLRLQHLLEQREAGRIGELRAPAVVFLEAGSGSELTLSGTFVTIKPGFTINGQHLLRSGDGWVVRFHGGTGSGSLKLGENLLRLNDEKDRPVDSVYVFRAKDKKEADRAMVEQTLVDQFLASKDPATPASQRITAQDLALQDGMLRKRLSTDPVSVRKNERGESLELRLLTGPAPAEYKIAAERIAKQWAKLGVKVNVQVPSSKTEFQDRLLRRDYDVLLFGESLLDNLDAFPYWHSSGMQKLGGNGADLRSDAFNLSQYASFDADTLLETIRKTQDEKERADALAKLRAVIRNDVPAIFLYSPTYIFGYQNIQGVELGSLSLHSDRFLTLYRWYVKQDRVFKEGFSWLNFPGWVWSML